MKKRVVIVVGVLVLLIVILALIICFKPREIKNLKLIIRKMESGIDLSLKLKMKLLSGLQIILWKMEIMLILKKLIGKNIMVN